MREKLSNLLPHTPTEPGGVETYGIPRGPGYSIRDVYESGSGKLLRTEVEWPESHMEPLSDAAIPPFAKGECKIIAWGGNKLAMADQGGQSDYLIKRYYRHHTYEGAGASERAQLATSQIKHVYTILRLVYGDYIPPTKIICAPYSSSQPERMAVYEIQKRALLTSVWQMKPEKESQKRVKEAEGARNKWSSLIEYYLKVKGIKLADDVVNFHPIYWDWVTMHLVAFDVIDGVDLDLPTRYI